MQLIYIVAVGALMWVSMLAVPHASGLDEPTYADDAQAQVDNYRSFLYVATQYMTLYAPTTPGVVSIDWPTMVASGVAPTGMSAASMPAGWRVVRAADMSWVACTEMDEAAMAAIVWVGDNSNPSSTANVPVHVPQGASSMNGIVVGDPSNAAKWTALCAS